MIPDMEQRMKETMEQASLKEVMPDFDKEAEWQRLSQAMRPQARRMRMRTWAFAAGLAVLITGGWMAWRLQSHSTHEVARVAPIPVPIATVKDSMPSDTAIHKSFVVVSEPAVSNKAQKNRHKAARATASVIFNGTPCPIELRISQMMRCPNNQPKAILSTSTVEPEQSGQLTYKENKSVGRHCSLTVKEIEIRSVATGEVIMLNARSLPVSAQEVFRYITHEKKGDVLAGVFNYDCDRKNRRHNLRLNNREGNLVLE